MWYNMVKVGRLVNMESCLSILRRDAVVEWR